MVRLFFTGIKHSGKTTQARLVSSLLGIGYADSDDLLTRYAGCASARDLYREKGREAFMEAEMEAVSSFVKESGGSFILSLGGGAADNTALMDLLKESGSIIYLRREEESMLPVILKHGMPAFLDKDDPASSFHRIYEHRDAIYREYADLTIDLGPYGDREKTAEQVVRALEENGYAEHDR